MIPHEKRAAVMRGLNEAFGVAEPEDIRDLFAYLMGRVQAPLPPEAP